MRAKVKLVFNVILLTLVLTVASCNSRSKKTEETTYESEYEKMKYTCSMHPEVVKDEPGECPKCGMALVEKKTEEHPEDSHEGHNH